MIKIDFEITSENGLHTYRDALYLEDNHGFSDSELEQMKKARFDKWLTIITTPADPVQVDPAQIDTTVIDAVQADIQSTEQIDSPNTGI